jgi:hypothetical protein
MIASSGCSLPTNVRFGSLADICSAKEHVRFTPNSDRESGFRKTVMSAVPLKRTCAMQLVMSALGQKRTFHLDLFFLAQEIQRFVWG